MSHKEALEALDRSLKDVRRCSRRMGGLSVLLAGDFRQTLSIIPRGTRADAVNASLRSLTLWPYIRKLTLQVNMRAQVSGCSDTEASSNILLDIGNGDFDNAATIIQIP